MASSSGASRSPAPQIPEDEIEEEQTDQTLPMTASVVLTALPKTASEALEGAGDLPQPKVKVRFQPVGSAPSLKQPAFMVSSTHRFSFLVTSLRKKLGVPSKDSVFCYVNSVFSPGLDESVGDLWRV